MNNKQLLDAVKDRIEIYDDHIKGLQEDLKKSRPEQVVVIGRAINKYIERKVELEWITLQIA